MANIALARAGKEWKKVEEVVEGFNPVVDSKYLIQNKGYSSLQIFEGATKPNDKDFEIGFEIQQFQAFRWTCKSDEYLWVRAFSNFAKFNIAEGE